MNIFQVAYRVETIISQAKLDCRPGWNSDVHTPSLGKEADNDPVEDDGWMESSPCPSPATLGFARLLTSRDPINILEDDDRCSGRGALVRPEH